MAARQKFFGPYRVRPIGGGVLEVVEMVDNTDPRTWQELRPRATYTNRQPAYGKCLRLNIRWQKGHKLEDDVLQYWKEATN